MQFNNIDNILREKVRQIRLLLLDVDGVMTDGRIIIDDNGIETKNFDVKDGHGIKMLLKNGIDVIIISGRKSNVVNHRAKELGIVDLYQGVTDKAAIFDLLIEKRMIKPENIASIGDDIVDVPLLKRSGFSIAVADAVDEVKKSSDYITKSKGGRGAVREICDLILHCQDKWETVMAKYHIS